MTQIERMIFEEGFKQGFEQGFEQGYHILIQDNIDRGTPKEKIIEKLEKYFNLSSEDAKTCYERYEKTGFNPNVCASDS